MTDPVPAAATGLPSSISNDAPLITATDALHEARSAYNASSEGSDLEAAYETAQTAAFDRIMSTQASSYAGLAAKARVLLVEIDGGTDYPDEASIAAKISEGLVTGEDRAAFSLALDITRLARKEQLRATSNPDAQLMAWIARMASHEAERAEYDRQADEAFERIVMPPIPEVLCWRPADIGTVCSNPYDLACYAEAGDAGTERYVYDAKGQLPELLQKHRESRNPHRGAEGAIARIEEILAAIENYQVAVQAAEDAAGYTAPTLASIQQSDLIRDLVRSIAFTQALTSEGVAAKAKVAASFFADTSDALMAALSYHVEDMGDGDRKWGSVLTLSVVIDAARLGSTSTVEAFSADLVRSAA